MTKPLPLSTQRCINRWYDLTEHPIQRQLVTDPHRFKVVPAGRRSGKTERAKRYVAHQALNLSNEKFFLAAPTRDQVKKIFWADMKLLSFAPLYPKQPSETELIIYIPNGSEIHLIGLDRPERMEGQFWSGGVIDEIGNVKEDAWSENISPALDTVDPSRDNELAWAWLIGVPEGLNHYYDLWEYAESGVDEDWKGYTWFSSDILPEKVIKAARRRMSARQFRQEYEASFETATGKIYEDFSKKNYTKATIQPIETIHWSHDFNYTPMSSAISVIRKSKETGEDRILTLDEIILTSAVAKNAAQEFVDRYKDHENKTLYLYGDPSGRQGEKHGQRSNYIEIETYLRANGWSVKRRVKNKAPAIRDRQNAVRAKIMNAAGEVSYFINPAKCPFGIKGLATTQLKEGSSFLEEEDDYQHITTAIGYFINFLYPIDEGTQISDL